MTHDKHPTNSAETNGTGSYKTLTIDWALYEGTLKDSGLSEAEKREFLEALWSIIVSFVDLGFGIHPLQQAGDQNCGQNFDCGGLTKNDPSTVLSSGSISSNNIVKGAGTHHGHPGGKTDS